MKIRPITVAETQIFARSAAKIWSEAELAELVDYVAHNPEAVAGFAAIIKTAAGVAEGDV